MKDIKCPLCGGMPQFATKDIDEIEVCQIMCKCGLATEVNEYWLNSKDDPEEDELRAWKDWEKLVSKFPPIMRISPGDRLAYDGWVCVVTCIDREKCTIDVVSTNPAEPFDPGIEDFTPPIDGAEITPDFVDAWPWELEQKGGK